ncbi:MAG: hypothetical protein ACQEWV_10870 [Bacillota bacterium]
MEHILKVDFIQEVEKTYKELYQIEKTTHLVIKKGNEIITCAGAFIKEAFYKALF